MRGQILAYVADSQMGLVVSPDGQRLSFREIDWQEPIPPARGMTVEFTAIEGDRARQLRLALPDTAALAHPPLAQRPKRKPVQVAAR